MNIETLDDWNALLGYCCDAIMPVCPYPRLECEISGWTRCGFPISDHPDNTPEENDTLYKQIVVTVVSVDGEDSSTTTSTYTRVITEEGYCESRLNGSWTLYPSALYHGMDEWVKNGTTFTKTVEGEDSSQTTTYAFSLPAESIEGEFTGFPSGYHECYASANEFRPITKAQYRWVIPKTWSIYTSDPFTGTYFKICWDIAFQPPEGDPSIISEDEVWEWTGPGDPENDDSWISPWFNLDAPPEDGMSFVANIRFECYRSKFGTKPQVMGEAVELVEPLSSTGAIGSTGKEENNGKTDSTGGLKTGGLRTGSLQTGGLRTGGLRISGLRTGGLRTGSLKTGGLRTGSLRTGSLRTSGLRTGTVRTGTLRTGGLRTSSLRTGGLRSGGLRTGGLKTGSV